MQRFFFSIAALLGMAGCITSCKSDRAALPVYPASAFESVIDNKPVTLYTLANSNGLTLQVTNWGCRVVSLWVPDRRGNFDDIVLGYESLDRYLNNPGERFLGSTIGRYGNRIHDGRFELNGEAYQLSQFNNGQCLHGGDKGFDKVVWNVDSVFSDKIYFSYLSPDGEEGFPGNLLVKMSYALTPQNEFRITYDAQTDKPTPVNLTHHSFFNLHGEGNGTINDHILTIAADAYTPVDSVLIPLGENMPVADTPFDFRTPKAIGRDVDNQDTQLQYGRGYDHNFVLNRKSNSELEFAASVYEPQSGRVLEVWTTEPGLQFYGGNFFEGKVNGKQGVPHRFRESLALETQHFPDSPNQPAFPSTILQPGEKYHHICVYKFACKD
ncbi:MAG: aldose epimerase family protein [Bacteroidales bacterium]